VDDKQKLRGTVLSAVKHRDVAEVTSPALIVTTGEFKTHRVAALIELAQTTRHGSARK
jgi:hypothetical protein